MFDNVIDFRNSSLIRQSNKYEYQKLNWICKTKQLNFIDIWNIHIQILIDFSNEKKETFKDYWWKISSFAIHYLNSFILLNIGKMW